MNACNPEIGREAADPFVLWGRILLDDPGTGLDDLLSGRGARGAQQRAEPEDFLADLLSHPAWRDERARLIEGLDEALLDWIVERFRWSPADIDAFGARAYAAQLSDSLKIAARLPLDETVRAMTRDHVTWDDRFRGLRWPGDLDLPWQFNLVLSRNQPDNRFISRWFTICDEAAWGAPHWRSDLNVGLLGLRKLPEPETPDTGPETRVAAALARFGSLALERGMNRQEVERAIRRRRAALTVFYPRHDEHWRDVWAGALESVRSPSQEGDAFSILADCLGEGSGRRGPGGQPARGGLQRIAALPNMDRLARITREIDESESLHDDLWEKVRRLIREHWAYASGAGETHFAVRTTHNLCDRVLRLRPGEPRLTEIHVWTLQAIGAESDNAYPWDLWAKVLSALGRDDNAMSVRWESVRRFPDNCVPRNSLAEGLRDRDRIPLAERLLRETARDFPGDPVSRTILADLLGRTEREGEAEDLLRETMQHFPRNTVCRHMLAYMLWRQGRQEDARAELEALERLAPDDTCVISLAEMIAGDGSWNFRYRDGGVSTDEPDVVGGKEFAAPGSRSPGGSDERDAKWGQRESRQAGETRDGAAALDADPAVLAYLDRLTEQTPLLGACFAPSVTGAVPGSASDPSRPDEARSDSRSGVSLVLSMSEAQGPYAAIFPEIALVAAHRAGRLEGQERERLRTWVKVRPSSYSARLLFAWGGQEGNGLGREAMSGIAADFPEHRRWNEWLSYPFTSEEQRRSLRERESHLGGPNGKAFWSGRLSTVYPDLKVESQGHGGRPSYDPAAMRRLLEDVALATADRSLPSISIP